MLELNIDLSKTKNEIRDELLEFSDLFNGTLSRSRANNYADQLKKGKAKLPDLMKLIAHSDPTADMAVNRVMKERRQVLLAI